MISAATTGKAAMGATKRDDAFVSYDSCGRNAASHEEKQCIRAALAFVVLRRRAAAAAEKNECQSNDNSTLKRPAFAKTVYRQSLCSYGPRNLGKNGVVQHFQSMISVAITTAMPLYDRAIVVAGNAANISTEIQQPPLIYDFLTASLPLDQLQQRNGTSCSNKNAVSSYKILDGILQHLVSQFQILEKRENKSDEEESMMVASRIFFETFTLINIGSAQTQEVDEEVEPDKASTQDQKRSILLIMSICTIFHRLTYWHIQTSIPIVKSICKCLHNEYNNANGMHHFVSDVLVVNLITLLEGIVALIISSSDQNKKARSMIASIMRIFQSEFKDLIVPVPINEMAKFYYQHEQQEINDTARENKREIEIPSQKAATSASSKFLIRLALYDTMQKLSSWYI